jgi:hypothetical protein
LTTSSVAQRDGNVVAAGWQDELCVWLEVAAAVDYLTDTHRPGLSVWDALDEAIRWWTAELVDPRGGFPARRAAELPSADPDPLRSSLEALLTVVPPPNHRVLARSAMSWPRRWRHGSL